VAYDEEKGELDVQQELDFQRRVWKWQRVCWVLMALLILSTLLGLFGQGLLSDAVAGDRSAPLWLEYNRFGRLHAETTELRVHLGAGVARDGEVRFWLGREYLEGVKILQVTPRPERVEVGADRFTFVFHAAELSAPTVLTFYLEAEQIGRLRATAGLDEGASLGFSQFIYP
jgi:hypothetical protein